MKPTQIVGDVHPAQQQRDRHAPQNRRAAAQIQGRTRTGRRLELGELAQRMLTFQRTVHGAITIIEEQRPPYQDTLWAEVSHLQRAWNQSWPDWPSVVPKRPPGPLKTLGQTKSAAFDVGLERAVNT